VVVSFPGTKVHGNETSIILLIYSSNRFFIFCVWRTDGHTNEWTGAENEGMRLESIEDFEVSAATATTKTTQQIIIMRTEVLDSCVRNSLSSINLFTYLLFRCCCFCNDGSGIVERIEEKHQVCRFCERKIACKVCFK